MIFIHVAGHAGELHHCELTSVLQAFDNVTVTADPDLAEIIVMGDGRSSSVQKMDVYKRFPQKCVAISDSDVLDYYLPALYASNHKTPLSRHRALTCSPYTSLFAAEGRRNAWIDRLIDEPMPKTLLYSFMGGSTCMMRKRLLRQYKSIDLPDVHVAATDHYKHWSPDTDGPIDKSVQQRLYIETMRRSKFALCPRGASPSSIRLFEAMELGVAPVVMADTWIPVDGVDWSFCLFVKENQIARLDAIVRFHEEEWRERGAAARLAFTQHFGPQSLGRTLERQFRQLQDQRSIHRERIVHAVYPALQVWKQSKAMAREHLRTLVLRGFRLIGRPFPYELNR